LSCGDEEKKRGLCAFLDSARGADALYILGDLFEIWTGPGDLKQSAFKDVFDSLRAVAGSGTPVTLIRGNRDFLMGRAEAKSLRLAGVVDTAGIELGGLKVHLDHGDTFCTRDSHYQGYKRVVRSLPARALLRSVPRPLGRRIGAHFRRHSKSVVRQKGRRMTGLSEAALREHFARTGADVIICGHVHRRQEIELSVDGRTRRVYVLGAWGEGPEALVYQDGIFSFIS
jgi:UDP-2,3-diacylglucosamine hydrolase